MSKVNKKLNEQTTPTQFTWVGLILISLSTSSPPPPPPSTLVDNITELITKMFKWLCTFLSSYQLLEAKGHADYYNLYM